MYSQYNNHHRNLVDFKALLHSLRNSIDTEQLLHVARMARLLGITSSVQRLE